MKSVRGRGMAESRSLPAIGGVELKVGIGATSYNRRPGQRSNLKHRDRAKERLLASKLKDIKFAEKLGKTVQLRLFKKAGRNRKLWPIVAERVKAETDLWIKEQRRQSGGAKLNLEEGARAVSKAAMRSARVHKSIQSSTGVKSIGMATSKSTASSSSTLTSTGRSFIASSAFGGGDGIETKLTETDGSLRQSAATTINFEMLGNASKLAETEEAWELFPQFLAARELAEAEEKKKQKLAQTKRYQSILDQQLQEKRKRELKEKELEKDYYSFVQEDIRSFHESQRQKEERERQKEAVLKAKRAKQLAEKQQLQEVERQRVQSEEARRLAKLRAQEKELQERELQRKELEKKELERTKAENRARKLQKEEEERVQAEIDRKQMLEYQRKLEQEHIRRMARLSDMKQRQAEIASEHDKTAGASQRELARAETRRLEKQAAETQAAAKREERRKAERLEREKEERLRSLRMQQEMARRRKEEERRAKDRARAEYQRQQAQLEREEEAKRLKKAEDVKRYRQELANQIAYRESVQRKKLAMSMEEKAMNEPLLVEIEAFARTKGKALVRGSGGTAGAGGLIPRAKQSTIALG